jgi:antitoxin StbD
MQIHPDETISATDMQRRAKEIFDRIESGEQEKFVVLRNNEIAAVLLPASRYEALLDELDDLRSEALAAERLSTFDRTQAVTHEEMLARFSPPGVADE